MGPDGKADVQLVLKQNGTLIYRDPRVEFRGSWGLGHWQFLFRCERLLQGQWEPKDQVCGWGQD